MWVFAAITTAFVGLAARVAEYFETGVFLPGVAAAVGFGAGLAIQAAGRRWAWGPRSGVVGILCAGAGFLVVALGGEAPSLPLFFQDRKSTRLNSSHVSNSYAVFCLKKKKQY